MIEKNTNQNKFSYFLSLAVLVIILIYISKSLDMDTIGRWIGGIDNQIFTMGIWGPILIFALRSISIIIPILPGTYCSILSGYFFGFQAGLLIVCLADFLACSASFTLSRRFGTTLAGKLVGHKFMTKVENFSKKNLEGNFFLMTGFLMSNLFDFVCYGIGLTKVSWKRFMPALIFSIIVSDAPFVASGYALKGLSNIEVSDILNGDINSLSGMQLNVFVLLIAIVFILAIVNIIIKNKKIELN